MSTPTTTAPTFGPVKTTGYTDAATTPVGAVVECVYFVEPGHYGYPAEGEHDSFRDALAASIEAHKAAEVRNRQVLASDGPRYLPLPEAFSIDCRWKMTYPSGGGIDTVMSRTAYESIAEAEAHLARVEAHAAGSLL